MNTERTFPTRFTQKTDYFSAKIATEPFTVMAQFKTKNYYSSLLLSEQIFGGLFLQYLAEMS